MKKLALQWPEIIYRLEIRWLLPPNPFLILSLQIRRLKPRICSCYHLLKTVLNLQLIWKFFVADVDCLEVESLTFLDQNIEEYPWRLQHEILAFSWYVFLIWAISSDIHLFERDLSINLNKISHLTPLTVFCIRLQQEISSFLDLDETIYSNCTNIWRFIWFFEAIVGSRSALSSFGILGQTDSWRHAFLQLSSNKVT